MPLHLILFLLGATVFATTDADPPKQPEIVDVQTEGESQ